MCGIFSEKLESKNTILKKRMVIQSQSSREKKAKRDYLTFD